MLLDRLDQLMRTDDISIDSSRQRHQDIIRGCYEREYVRGVNGKIADKQQTSGLSMQNNNVPVCTLARGPFIDTGFIASYHGPGWHMIVTKIILPSMRKALVNGMK